MNFKTTLILLIALVVVGAVVMFRGKSTDQTPTQGTTARKLLPVEPYDVSEITVTSSPDGDVLAMTRVDGGEWRLTKPVNAAADRFAVDDLVRQITSLESRSQVDITPATGLDTPRYTIALVARGKTYELQVGDQSAVGENLYVKLPDQPRADVVAAAQLVAQLAKPVKEYRKLQLASEPVDQFHNVTVTQNGQTIALAKTDGKWSVVAPTTMPADASAVNDLLYGITGLRAEEFVAEGEDTTALGQPRLSISYETSTSPASTQPTTQPPKTIVIGRYADISRKSLLATSSSLGAVVKVPATALDVFNKKPIELRDKQVLSLDASKIGTIELTSDLAATTQPATRPASKSSVILTRRPPAPPAPVGPPAPTTAPATTAPATGPATTQAATTTQATTQPQLSAWLAGDIAADDAAVDALLTQFASLRAEKFVESVPLVSQPVATYTLVLTIPPTGPSMGERHEIRVTDFGNDASVFGSYNDLTFELPRSILTALSGEFVAGK
jgi:hypothetical protein